MSSKTGYSLRKIRKILGLSPKEMGEYLDVEDSTVEKYETGHRNIPFEKLRKLTTGQNVWSLDELDKGSLPDINLSNIDFNPMMTIFAVLFPIIKPTDLDTSSVFADTYNHHMSLLDFSFATNFNENNIEEYNLNWVVNQIRQYKGNYALAAKKVRSLRPYCAANIISLTLFYACYVNQIIHKDCSLISFALLKKLDSSMDGDDSDDDFIEGFDAQFAYNELHRKFVYDRLQNYLNIISELPEQNELIEYYTLMLYFCDLVNTKLGWEKSRKIAERKQAALYKSGNPYMKDFINLIMSIYHISL